MPTRQPDISTFSARGGCIFVALFVTCFGAACPARAPVAQVGGARAVVVAPAPRPKLAEPARVALQFWRGLAAKDLDRMEKLVSFPFMWDARCRIFTSFEQIYDRLARKRARPRRIAVAYRRELTSSSKGVHPRVRRSYRKLSARRGGCDPATDALVRRAAALHSRYILVDLLLGKRPAAPGTWVLGKTRVPSMTRVSLVRGEWKVTGIDN